LLGRTAINVEGSRRSAGCAVAGVVATEAVVAAVAVERVAPLALALRR